jgi:hypothetical protein
MTPGGSKVVQQGHERFSRTSATRRMGPRLRGDDAEYVSAPRQISNSNFKQPRLLVLAPPRELGF